MKENVKVSFIIPTHNRFEEAYECIKTIFSLENSDKIEVILVDNNSTDNTKTLVEFFPDIKYVFEVSTAFSRARDAGAKVAQGEILIFMDDDATLKNSVVDVVVEFMDTHPRCGILAGRILAKFETEPPVWARQCQKSKNAWSLYDFELKDKSFKKVKSACGPLMAIRKDLYFKVGGFPPDTLGVEGKSNLIFNKWYVGPGDWGLCRIVKSFGYVIFFHKEFVCLHKVSNYRIQDEFWYSRYFGEGIYRALNSLNFQYNPLYLGKFFKFYLAIAYFKNSVFLLFDRILTGEFKYLNKEILNLIEINIAHVVLNIFKKDKKSSQIIWDAAKIGINDYHVEKFLNSIPTKFIKLQSLQYEIQLIKPFTLRSILSFRSQIKEIVELK